MPATCPAYLIHTAESVTRFGLPSEPDPLWLHEIVDTADRQRVSIIDENSGISIYEAFTQASASYKIDAHTRSQSGIANYHPGQSIGASVITAANSDPPFQFEIGNGYFVYTKPERRRPAAEIHKLQFTIEHIFPETDRSSINGGATGFYPTSTNNVIDIDIDTGTPLGGVDPVTGIEQLRALRIHYTFTAARGPLSDRTGYVTRLLSSSAIPSVSEVLSYGNPTDYEWQNIASVGTAYSVGPDWSTTDQTAGAIANVPGVYTISGIYELNSHQWLYSTGGLEPSYSITGVEATDVITTGSAHGLAINDVVFITAITGGAGITADPSKLTKLYVKTVPSSTTLTLSATLGGATLNFTTDISAGTIVDGALAYDSPAHGTKIVVVVFTSGLTRQLLIGNYGNTAAVLATLGLANVSTLTAIYEATSNTFYHGNLAAVSGAFSDLLDFWRITTAQSKVSQYLQLYQVMGPRTHGSYSYVRATLNDLTIAHATGDLPDPPLEERWNSLAPGATLYPGDPPTVVYNYNDATYDTGNAGVVASLGKTVPSAGSDLWIYKWKQINGSSYSHQWEYLIGSIANAQAFWTARGHSGTFNATTQQLYDVIYKVNSGTYSVGDASDGNPLLMTTGISTY